MHSLGLGLANRMPIASQISAPAAIGWYVDASGGSDSNNGSSPATPFQSFAPFANFTDSDFTKTIFYKTGSTYAPSIVLALRTNAGPGGNEIGASQNIGRSSGATAAWVMRDGRVIASDGMANPPGFQYADTTEKIVQLILPSGATGVTSVSLVSGRYTPGTGTGIPSLAGFTSLVTVDVSLNNFGGSIQSFAGDTSLVTCLLDHTGTTGVVPSFSTCTALVTMWLQANTLSGILPSYGACTALQELRMESNSLSGTLPSFTTCQALITITGYDNLFSGTMPSFSGCTALQSFNLASCAFTGTLPSFAACAALTSFDAHGNTFSTGTVSGSFATQKNLATIDLSFCSLTPTQLNVILADCVTSLGISGRVVCNLNIKQSAGSVSGQGLTDIATLTSAGWTVQHF